MMQWLYDTPYLLLIFMAVLMALMPFQPEPHLLEKFHMFKAGELHRLIDLFDVFWHLLPSILLLIKIVHDVRA